MHKETALMNPWGLDELFRLIMNTQSVASSRWAGEWQVPWHELRLPVDLEVGAKRSGALPRITSHFTLGCGLNKYGRQKEKQRQGPRAREGGPWLVDVWPAQRGIVGAMRGQCTTPALNTRHTSWPAITNTAAPLQFLQLRLTHTYTHIHTHTHTLSISASHNHKFRLTLSITVDRGEKPGGRPAGTNKRLKSRHAYCLVCVCGCLCVCVRVWLCTCVCDLQRVNFRS